MEKGSRKRRTFRKPASESEQLRGRSEKLREDFANVDLDTARTFLDLARLDFESGEVEHATRLLENAEKAAQVVGDLIKRFPENAVPALRSRLEALNKAISEVKALAS
jgi:hypothetical protein